jgi:uncharacterized RDD family membrane protein YckC
MQTVTSTTVYAGFWRRVAAVLLDGLILAIVEVPIALLLVGADAYSDPTRVRPPSGLSTALAWLYFALMESSPKQATLGKMALGIVVTDLEGRRIGFGRATGRHFAKILSALILGIGFLMVAFTERKQGLHDLLAKTLVVKGVAPTTGVATTGGPPMPPPPPMTG